MIATVNSSKVSRGIYYHYSESPDLTISKIETTRKDVAFKPPGFWVSDDTRGLGWKDWCVSEHFRLESLVYKYAVSVDLTNLLILDTREKLIKFLHTYQSSTPSYSTKEYFVDWKRVKKYYAGICFTPFNREWSFLHNSLSWYSSIDCDSVCIWAKSAILSFGKPETFII